MEDKKIILMLFLVMVGCAPGPNGTEVRIAESVEIKTDEHALGRSLEKRGLIDRTYLNGETALAFKKDGTFKFILAKLVKYYRLDLGKGVVTEVAHCRLGITGSASQISKGLSLDFKEVKLLGAESEVSNVSSIPTDILCREFAKRVSQNKMSFSYKMFNPSYIEINQNAFDIQIKNKNGGGLIYEFESTLMSVAGWSSDSRKGRVFLFSDDSQLDLTTDFLEKLKGHFNNQDLALGFDKDLNAVTLRIRDCKKTAVIKDFKVQASLDKMSMIMKGSAESLDCSEGGAMLAKNVLNNAFDLSLAEKSYLSIRERNLTLTSNSSETVQFEFRQVLEE